MWIRRRRRNVCLPPSLSTGRVIANGDVAMIMGLAEMDGLAEMNRLRFKVISKAVEGYLDKCGRQWVSMGSIFSFCTPVA